eukprot:364239_1
MFQVTQILLLLCICILIVVHSGCHWDVSNYGFVDFTPISKIHIEIVREAKNQYSLLYSPCSNALYCDTKNSPANGMALQIRNNALPNIDCDSIISSWDNGHTTPQYQPPLANNTTHTLVFNYPVYPAKSDSDGCNGGRRGQFTFICNKNAIPYSPIHFSQDTKDENGVCAYYATIETKYACVTNTMAANNSFSVGSIILICFISTILMYCVIGYVINGHKQHQWMDIKNNIPQFNWWLYLGHLVKVGFDVSMEFISGTIQKYNDKETDQYAVEDDINEL